MAVLIASLAAGCESTQDKAEKLRSEASAAFTEKGLRITKVSKDVKVTRKQVFADANGIAVAVQLRNTSGRALARVPIAIDVRAANGKSLFRNDAPGLAASLTSISLIRPKETVWWVNDQVLATGKPAKVVVKVGRSPAFGGKAPEVAVTPPRFEEDPVSGLSVSGKATNRSDILQREFTLFAVARKGDQVIAAGRGAIDRLKPRDTAGWQVFFIGNPRGGEVELVAPPTKFQ